jgi:hypothetical protein
MNIIINTQLGPFNITNSEPLNSIIAQKITRLFGPTSIVTIALTILNCFTSILLIVLILVDNPQLKYWWKIVPSNRIPLGLAVSIFVSHGIFIAKEFIGLEAFESFDPPDDKRLLCHIFNELGYWGMWSTFICANLGIWVPLVTMVMRVFITIGGMVFKVRLLLNCLTKVRCVWN